MNTKKIIPLLSLVFLALHVGAQRLPNIGDPRVQIKLPTVKGDSLSLASLTGKVVLLDFWASWCAPCRSANKKLVKLYDKYKDKGFEIFSVSLDENKKNWEKAIARDKMTWSHVNDPRGNGAQTAVDWNVFLLPTSYLINKKGDVVSVDPDGKELEESVKALLQE